MVSSGPGVIIHCPLLEKIVHPDSSSITGHTYSALTVPRRTHPPDKIADTERLSNVINGFIYDFFKFKNYLLVQR